MIIAEYSEQISMQYALRAVTVFLVIEAALVALFLLLTEVI